ncbi:MAG: 6-phosphogluconolactonase [Caulobacteraceae bacterium]|nr:6-phosphogluconolactonase [Caulobacteraceae bacterium]
METFADGDALADAAADALAQALEGTGPRSLVVTGGRSPGPVYDRLSSRDLSWDEVTVTLSDERWVDPGAAESNARFVRERLLNGRAAAARFVPLKGAGPTPEADAREVEPALRPHLPWSAVLLGMGEDGHVASLFPGDPDLAARLDPDGPRLCVGVAAAGLPPLVPRLTLTARTLLDTRLVLLLITGEAKRAIVERVLSDPAYSPPAAAVLRQDRAPVRVLWAP